MARGMCRRHYHFWWKQRDPSEPLRLPTRKPEPTDLPPIPCAGCSTVFNPKMKTHRFCSSGCRERGKYGRKKTLTCAVCASPIWQSRTSKPQGEATCLPCKRRAKGFAAEEKIARRTLAECKYVGCTMPPTFATKQPGWYCSTHREIVAAKRRGRDRHYGKSTEARGYGAAHRKLRKQWKVLVDAGGVCCARCGKEIAPGALWDLDHDDLDRTKYLGASCRRCNRASTGNPEVARKRRQTIIATWEAKQAEAQAA